MPLPSPTPVVMIAFSPLLSSTSATVAETPLKTTMIWAPASLNWRWRSRGVYIGLTLTCTAPARAMPRKAIGNASRLGIVTAMRSPFFTPSLACRWVAKSRDRWSRSASVSVCPAQRIAGRSAKRVIARSIMSTTER